METPFEPYMGHSGIKKAPNIVLYSKISQPYSQYPLQARASDGAIYPFLQVTKSYYSLV